MQSYGATNRGTWICKFRELEKKNDLGFPDLDRAKHCSGGTGTVHRRRAGRRPEEEMAGAGDGDGGGGAGSGKKGDGGDDRGSGRR